jgi:hypothetical protein
VEKRFRRSHSQFGHPYIHARTLELRFRLLDGTLLRTEDGEVWVFTRIQWMSYAMLGAAQMVVQRCVVALDLDRPLTEGERFQIEYINSGENRHDARLSTTLDLTAIKSGIHNGTLRTYTVETSLTIYFLDKHDDPPKFLLVGGSKNRWFKVATYVKAYLCKKYRMVLFCRNGDWGLAMFERSARTSWDLKPCGEVMPTAWKKGNSRGWLQRRAAKTALYNVCFFTCS